jgi:uroporphyrinogen decarboxylase
MVETLKNCPKDKLIMGKWTLWVWWKWVQPKSKSIVIDLWTKLRVRQFVLSTGCDLPPHVPSENISAFLKHWMITTKYKKKSKQFCV